MPTPVGPAPRDPNDPDLWEEWYDTEDGEVAMGRSRFGWPVRIVVLVVIVTLVVLMVVSG